MSDQNGYIKDEDLPKLTRTELVEKVRKGRHFFREAQKQIEALEAQLAEKNSDITALERQIADRGESVKALLETLEEVCTPIAVACRQVQAAKETLKPYWKHNNNGGGQHQSAPSQ